MFLNTYSSNFKAFWRYCGRFGGGRQPAGKKTTNSALLRSNIGNTSWTAAISPWKIQMAIKFYLLSYLSNLEVLRFRYLKHQRFISSAALLSKFWSTCHPQPPHSHLRWRSSPVHCGTVVDLGFIPNLLP